MTLLVFYRFDYHYWLSTKVNKITHLTNLLPQKARHLSKAVIIRVQFSLLSHEDSVDNKTITEHKFPHKYNLSGKSVFISCAILLAMFNLRHTILSQETSKF